PRPSTNRRTSPPCGTVQPVQMSVLATGEGSRSHTPDQPVRLGALAPSGRAGEPYWASNHTESSQPRRDVAGGSDAGNGVLPIWSYSENLQGRGDAQRSRSPNVAAKAAQNSDRRRLSSITS